MTDTLEGELASAGRNVATLQVSLGHVTEALLQTQMMLEQIVHHKSTDFAEVHRRILANRKALGGSHD